MQDCKRKRIRKNSDGSYNQDDIDHNDKCAKKYMLRDNSWIKKSRRRKSKKKSRRRKSRRRRSKKKSMRRKSRRRRSKKKSMRRKSKKKSRRRKSRMRRSKKKSRRRKSRMRRSKKKSRRRKSRRNINMNFDKPIRRSKRIRRPSSRMMDYKEEERKIRRRVSSRNRSRSPRPPRSPSEACKLMLLQAKIFIKNNNIMLKNEKESQNTMKVLKIEFNKCNSRRQNCMGLKRALMKLKTLENEKQRLTDIRENALIAARTYSSDCTEAAMRTDSQIVSMPDYYLGEDSDTGYTSGLGLSGSSSSNNGSDSGGDNLNSLPFYQM
jgi:hypothetical protein